MTRAASWFADLARISAADTVAGPLTIGATKTTASSVATATAPALQIIRPARGQAGATRLSLRRVAPEAEPSASARSMRRLVPGGNASGTRIASPIACMTFSRSRTRAEQRGHEARCARMPSPSLPLTTASPSAID